MPQIRPCFASSIVPHENHRPCADQAPPQPWTPAPAPDCAQEPTPSSAQVSIIAAVARNRVIGRDGKLPWHIGEDLRRFKRLTQGGAAIMGRRTCESILAALGRPLPERASIVLSRDPDFAAPGCLVVQDIEAALRAARRLAAAGPVFVIGGAEIYALALPFASRLYLTEIDQDMEGDVRFPAYSRAHWRETSREPHRTLERLRFDFVVYERVSGTPAATA
ncbi:MAG: dihydrofolate reductase [Burkholderiales bacterium]|nr:dihydrofolate reductase [Burkholderiales bacterium]